MARTRQRSSLGGSSMYNTRSASEPRRRMSLDPSEGPSSPKKDRRAMLEEWRQQVRAGRTSRSHASPSTSSSDVEENDCKRARHETPPLPNTARYETPPLPRRPTTDVSPAPLPSPSVEGMTALERFRARRAHQQQNQVDKENASPCLPPHPPSFDSGVAASSPKLELGSKLLSRGRLSLSGVRRSRRRSVSTGALSRRSADSACSDASVSPPKEIKKPPLKQMTPLATEDIGSVESSALRSRLQQMQTRITELEREKLDLTKSKAPLEARFRQKEETWQRDQARMLSEIDELNLKLKISDEKYRELEVEKNTAVEERSRYKYEALKAASTLRSEEQFDIKIQNDREISELKEKLRDAQYEIKSLQIEKISLESDLHQTKSQLQSLENDYEELKYEYDDLNANRDEASEAAIQLQVLTTEHIATSAQLNAVCADLAATKSSAKVSLEEKEKELKSEIAALKFQMSVLKTRGSSHIGDEKVAKDEEDEAVLKARIEERDARIADLEAQLMKGEKIRRMMHNRIQELRGNIRVYVRTRPFLPGDGSSGCGSPSQQSAIDVMPDGESLAIADRTGKNSKFSFDKVFPPSAGQNCVFEEVSDFVQSALDGYHVCLFSYGQTGSGKTHTMQGSGNGAMRGIIPRAVAQILNQAKILQSQKWQFNMSASFLEIYNEELKDLLGGNNGTTASHRSGGMTTRSKKLSIKRNAEGKSFVDGLTKEVINTEDATTGLSQLDNLMSVAARARSVASTNMNAQSSRSHSVFMLHLHGYNDDSGTTVSGALNLCDLAGSERLDRSGAGSDIRRLKETQAINKSLSCLGDVFNSLANGSPHVPYRNSKLTYLLQDCLSGDGKALMFVNLSPTIESSGESLCSLRFAQRVNQVELGKATKHVHYKSKK